MMDAWTDGRKNRQIHRGVTYVYIYIYIYIYTHTYIHTRMHAYIHTHTHTYITYIYTYMHTSNIHTTKEYFPNVEERLKMKLNLTQNFTAIVTRHGKNNSIPTSIQNHRGSNMHLRKSSTDNRPPNLWMWNTNKREKKAEDNRPTKKTGQSTKKN